jgi:ubiquinone/menaquinone biosynthesis C-methylase UbiE
MEPLDILDTYDPSFFQRLKKIEKNHFWFHIRRKWIFDKIKKVVSPPAKLLEVGCGTGNVSSFLAKKGYIVTGCEYYREAINMGWPGYHKVQGNATNLKFGDNSLDIVGLFDVLEHFQDDITPLKEAVRVLKKGGIIVLTVPAREELWSHFDKAAMHKRRYTKERLKRIFSDVRIKPLLIEYMFMSLYFPIKFRGKRREHGDPFRINILVNTFLKGIFDIERFISKCISLPIGTSLIAVAQKN